MLLMFLKFKWYEMSYNYCQWDLQSLGLCMLKNFNKNQKYKKTNINKTAYNL